MVNQHSVDYHTSPSGLTSRIHPLILLLNPKGFISLQKVFNFLSNLSIPAWFGKSFKFVVFGLLEKCMES